MPQLSTTRFTDARLAELKAKAGGGDRVHFDAATQHLGIRFRRKRATFFCWYRTADGVRRVYLGEWPKPLALDEARSRVALTLAEHARGKDPLEERRAAREAARQARRQAADAEIGTVEKRFKLFVKEKGREGLRTVGEYESVFRNHILPAWGARPANGITRRDVAVLLDKIADKHGVMLADRTLAYLRPFIMWHAAKYDHPAPVLTKLRRLKPDALRRERSLSDVEMRALWAAAGEFEPKAFGAFIRLLLVTGQRRIEVAGMRRAEIGPDDVWTIPAARFKGKREHSVPLSKKARELIDDVPRLNDEFVLSTGESHLRGFSKFKLAFDAAMLDKLFEANGEAPTWMPQWGLHDLRRTARSLLSRAGVRPDWAEIYIGHALPGLRKTYDRYEYIAEKRFAADALAHSIERVLTGDTGAVLEFKPSAAA